MSLPKINYFRKNGKKEKGSKRESGRGINMWKEPLATQIMKCLKKLKGSLCGWSAENRRMKAGDELGTLEDIKLV